MVMLKGLLRRKLQERIARQSRENKLFNEIVEREKRKIADQKQKTRIREMRTQKIARINEIRRRAIEKARAGGLGTRILRGIAATAAPPKGRRRRSMKREKFKPFRVRF